MANTPWRRSCSSKSARRNKADGNRKGPGDCAMIRIVPSYVAGLTLGVLGLVFCIGAFRLGFWTDDGPGPGLLPLVAGALLIPLIVVALREPEPQGDTA